MPLLAMTALELSWSVSANSMKGTGWLRVPVFAVDVIVYIIKFPYASTVYVVVEFAELLLLLSCESDIAAVIFIINLWIPWVDENCSDLVALRLLENGPIEEILLVSTYNPFAPFCFKEQVWAGGGDGSDQL